MSLLDLPAPVIDGTKVRRVAPLGHWSEELSEERRQAQRLNALKGAAKRPKMTREQKLERRRLRRLELKGLA